jgi:hypothetical protein
LQTLLWQSLAPVQVLPFAHLFGQGPPQSVSLSVPFLTPSPQVGAEHVPVAAGQTPLWQSPGTAHVFPVPHLPHAAPPQSMALSVPFLTRSEQLGVWQMFDTHTPLLQSFGPTHVLPSRHLFGQLPPQSTSVSAPFFTMSVQLAV